MGGSKRSPFTVVKVGGSLFDLPDLGPRLRKWLAERWAGHVLVVPGGGPVADVLRAYDRLHALGEERAHWLALRVLALNAHFLGSLLPEAVIVSHVQPPTGNGLQRKMAILDPYTFARADEGHPGCLPHCWAVTSDSLAVRAARLAEADELILLKSVTLPANIDWAEAAKRGLVDAYFHEAAKDFSAVRFINFRCWV